MVGGVREGTSDGRGERARFALWRFRCCCCAACPGVSRVPAAVRTLEALWGGRERVWVSVDLKPRLGRCACASYAAVENSSKKAPPSSSSSPRRFSPPPTGGGGGERGRVQSAVKRKIEQGGKIGAKGAARARHFRRVECKSNACQGSEGMTKTNVTVSAHRKERTPGRGRRLPPLLAAARRRRLSECLNLRLVRWGGHRSIPVRGVGRSGRKMSSGLQSKACVFVCGTISNAALLHYSDGL